VSGRAATWLVARSDRRTLAQLDVQPGCCSSSTRRQVSDGDKIIGTHTDLPGPPAARKSASLMAIASTALGGALSGYTVAGYTYSRSQPD